MLVTPSGALVLALPSSVLRPPSLMASLPSLTSPPALVAAPSTACAPPLIRRLPAKLPQLSGPRDSARMPATHGLPTSATLTSVLRPPPLLTPLPSLTSLTASVAAPSMAFAPLRIRSRIALLTSLLILSALSTKPVSGLSLRDASPTLVLALMPLALMSPMSPPAPVAAPLKACAPLPIRLQSATRTLSLPPPSAS